MADLQILLAEVVGMPEGNCGQHFDNENAQHRYFDRGPVMNTGAVGRFMVERHKRARLMIADDHILLAEARKSLLEPEFKVVPIVGDGRALLQAAELKPDVVIVDIAMPQLNGLDAGEQVKHFLPSVKLVFLTMSLDTEVAVEAFRRGASGYVVKGWRRTICVANVQYARYFIESAGLISA